MTSYGGQVVVRRRFSPGSLVRLYEVEGGRVMRPEVEPVMASMAADATGSVRFTDGVRVGGWYFAVGLDEGVPAEKRVRGLALDDASVDPGQPPVAPDRPRQVRGAPSPPRGPAPHASQGDVPAGARQRSDTPRGMATPVD